ncbi:uncharacterized protein K452DRAFT_158078 [Aplosporella prunicola CBS 121167]|uniref:Uncharacterized protein n=1 Tax=Aplosporella prunicola CBS 121167 TaxID=1176127 RepID=A0A6A6AXG4_9PEZI|nr:uncharacterized protein K452DRAFT_158078 [Aplosporella prunicola CBS 121167]KAF2135873.1 hypothetical protein K452DRAFT_158078 [Aplosporella prunicola CBS 121167]
MAGPNTIISSCFLFSFFFFLGDFPVLAIVTLSTYTFSMRYSHSLAQKAQNRLWRFKLHSFKKKFFDAS